jgi:YD repeat-containing protein
MPEEKNTQSQTSMPVIEMSPTPAQATAQSSWKQNMGIPGAIVIAAALIAGAIYFDGERKTGSLNLKGAPNAEQATAERYIAPITKEDHIRGNPNAPIVIVEYSDYDCPFCRVFHDTMTKVIDAYGKDGKVAWVYRHFPIAQLHPGAPKISEAAYCVTEQTGNEGFWKFTDALNESRKVTYDASGRLTAVDPTDMKRLPEFAVAAGADKNKFEICYNNGKYAEKVAADVQAAVKAGAGGTPYSVIMVGDQQEPIEGGAVPFEVLKGLIDSVITQLEGA